jgi:regulator of protease activity HflC (stomatin/prohibitin superfamily)
VSFGEFLKEALEWLYRFWPWRIVKDWEQGVRVRHGNATALLNSTNGLFKTGIHVFWPGIGEILVEETNVVTMETDLQTCTTKDGKAFTFSLGVKFKVKDLRAYYTKIHDADSTISEEARSAAGRACRELDLADCPEKLGDQTKDRAKRRMHGWGLELIDVVLINNTEAQVLRLIMDALT